MEKIKYPEMTEYISIADANKVQIMCKEIFENFDGGFGMYSHDDYLYHQAINGKNIDFGDKQRHLRPAARCASNAFEEYFRCC